MNKALLILFSISINCLQFSYAQKTTNYEHCNCTEIINYSKNDDTIRDGEYKLNCTNSLVEIGNYKNGNKDGLWTVKNENGKLISSIEFIDGKLNGKYELFDFDGNPKLKAEFENNLPKGEWLYFSKKGKIIKKGNYQNGKPIGIWNSYDSKGKKIITSYNFDKSESLASNQTKIKNSYLPRDDESGEYIIIYYPTRKHLSGNIPFNGNIVSNKEFIDLLNVPFILMNTITDYDFKIKAKVINGILKIEDINYAENINYNSSNLTFPYIAQTNSPNKLKTIKHSDLTINKIKERVLETLMVLGPWTSTTDDSFEIHVPFVLNNVK
ncbi:hypothetical protein [Maribacter sp.]|uniref:toxin-antitoxin system YwqK family antitoxin n=1 Tax=Maribacter sp. TaxID=1897614 RepID=UPI003298DB37